MVSDTLKIGIIVVIVAIIGIVGIVFGSFFGYVLMFIQEEFNIITLPSSVYFMSRVPFLITADTFILIAVITFLLCILASIIPSYIASKIKPVNALRFD